MAEQSLLVSCDCGYRDVRQEVKAHQKTCGVTIVPAQRRVTEDQEQDAAKSGEIILTSLLHPGPSPHIPCSNDSAYEANVFNWEDTKL